MAFSEFYMAVGQSGVSNLNAGSTSADAGGSNSPSYTSLAGNWNNATSVFTPTDGSTPAGTVNVNDWMSVYITGDTALRYVAKVLSVAAGVNGAITLDTVFKFGTSPATVSGTANVKDGGCWSDFGIVSAANSLAGTASTVSSAIRINVKAGTYNNTATVLTFNMAGTTAVPVWWRGYKTAPGDQENNAFAAQGTEIPLISFTTGQFKINVGNVIYSSMHVQGATVTAGGQTYLSSGNSIVTLYRFRSVCTGASVQSSASNWAAYAIAISCYFKCTTSTQYVVQSSAASAWMSGCYLSGGGASAGGGFFCAAPTALTANNCIFDSCAGDAILSTGQGSVISCSFYAPTGNGVAIRSATGPGLLIANCYFESFQSGKYPINLAGGANSLTVRCVGNAYYNCPSGTTTGLGDFPLIFDNGTLPRSAFLNPGAQDFRINPLGWNLGYPGPIENLSPNIGYLGIGALQPPEGTVINQIRNLFLQGEEEV
jgi:hypothetical protein